MNSKIKIDSGEVWSKMMGALLHAALENESRQHGNKDDYGATLKTNLPG
jgi:hypothetical protein